MLIQTSPLVRQRESLVPAMTFDLEGFPYCSLLEYITAPSGILRANRKASRYDGCLTTLNLLLFNITGHCIRTKGLIS